MKNKVKRWLSDLASKFEKDTKRREENSEEDIDAICCSFVCHFSFSFFLSSSSSDLHKTNKEREREREFDGNEVMGSDEGGVTIYTYIHTHTFITLFAFFKNHN